MTSFNYLPKGPIFKYSQSEELWLPHVRFFGEGRVGYNSVTNKNIASQRFIGDL
jgi:hypothetical protein